jgi:hypothetical protein
MSGRSVLDDGQSAYQPVALFFADDRCDPTINLRDWYVGVRNGWIEVLWPISARGASI